MHRPPDDPSMEPEYTPLLEDFKRLSLSEMLAEMPLRPIGNFSRYKLQMPRIVCMDGTSLSVQASASHYAIPRDDRGPYRAVEVGFPSIEPPLAWEPYAEEWKNPTGTVYAYIPLELVCFFIASHGGIDADKTFKRFEFKIR